MSRTQKRRTRMVAALAAAVLLSAALAWTSFTASSQAITPGDLVDAGAPGRAYQLTGKVVAGYNRDGQALVFGVRDRDTPAVVRVRYRGSVPDPFRAGREVIVTVRRQGGEWIGERDSLITKCPSKFTTDPDAR